MESGFTLEPFGAKVLVAPAKASFVDWAGDAGKLSSGELLVLRPVLSNLGSTVLTVESVSIEGDTVFALEGEDCTGAELIPSDSCTIEVLVSGDGAGPRAGTLRVTTSDPNQPTTELALAVAPSL